MPLLSLSTCIFGCGGGSKQEVDFDTFAWVVKVTYLLPCCVFLLLSFSIDVA